MKTCSCGRPLDVFPHVICRECADTMAAHLSHAQPNVNWDKVPVGSTPSNVSTVPPLNMIPLNPNPLSYADMDDLYGSML